MERKPSKDAKSSTLPLSPKKFRMGPPIVFLPVLQRIPPVIRAGVPFGYCRRTIEEGCKGPLIID